MTATRPPTNTELQTAISKLDAAIKAETKRATEAEGLLSDRITALETPTTPPPDPPPSSLISVPATFGALKTAVNASGPDKAYGPVAGTHGFQSGIGYAGIRIAPTSDRVSIIGPGAILAPKGVANGIAVLADGCQLIGFELNADPAGPVADANGSGLISVNGQSSSPGPGAYAPTRDTLLRRLIIRGAAVMDVSQHEVYLSGQLINVTLDDVQFLANGSKGYGLHDYHAGAGPSSNYLGTALVFDGFSVAGVLLWNDVDAVTFDQAVTKNSAKYSMRLGTGGDVYLNGCTLDKPILNEGSTVHQTTSLAAHRMALAAGLTSEPTPMKAKEVHRTRHPNDTPTMPLDTLKGWAAA